MTSTPQRSFARSLIKLARPTQWSKSVFVLIGPFYYVRDQLAAGKSVEAMIVPALLAAAAFALVSSACYVVNDIFDRVADRAHPRKKNRPIASGRVSVGQAWVFAGALLALAAGVTLAIGSGAPMVGLWLAIYAANVFAYSAVLKHHIMADVISLASGFVIRVMAGCVAIGIEPTVWLLNVTFFLSMFLAFGKRLGERRTLEGKSESGSRKAEGGSAAAHRRVQARYTDSLLQTAVVVSAAITLMTYALYVQDQAEKFHRGFWLWVSVLPLTYGLFRCIVLLEEGKYDDPTEIAVHDRGLQLAAGVFLVVTIGLMVLPGLLGS